MAVIKNTVSVKAFIRAEPTSGFDMQTNSEEWVGVALWGKEEYNSWSAYSHTMSVWFIYFRPNSKYTMLYCCYSQNKLNMGANEQKQLCLCKMFNSFVHYNKPWLHTNITGTDSYIYSVCVFIFLSKWNNFCLQNNFFKFVLMDITSMDHPGGCCTLVVDEEISPIICKMLWVPMRYINVTNYHYYGH